MAVKRLYPLLIIVFAIVVVSISSLIFGKMISQHTPLPKNLSQYKYVFGDEFEGNTLDEKKWAYCYDWSRGQNDGCTNFGNNELEWYLPSQTAVFDGSLHLVAEKKVTGGIDSQGARKVYPYTSGMITTGSLGQNNARWMNTYGYYEARMNAPEGKGLWPAFWLIPAGGEWPPEIDIMEILGDKPNEVIGTYFWRNEQQKVSKDTSTYKASEKYTNSWHVYGMDWGPGYIDWYIDGVKVRGIKGKYVPDKPLMIVLNLAVGGTLPQNPDEKTMFPAALLVDYVRVYKKS